MKVGARARCGRRQQGNLVGMGRFLIGPFMDRVAAPECRSNSTPLNLSVENGVVRIRPRFPRRTAEPCWSVAAARSWPVVVSSITKADAATAAPITTEDQGASANTGDGILAAEKFRQHWDW